MMYRIDHAMQPSAAGTAAAPRQTLLVVGPACCLGAAALGVIEHAFPALVVEHAACFAAAHRQFAHPLRLVLVEAAYLEQNRQHAVTLSQHHAAAPITAVLEDGSRPTSMLEAKLAGQIQGVVPIHQKVDVWLAVLQLLLRGIPYFPSWVLRASTMCGEDSKVMIKAKHAQSCGPEALDSLTGRETDILELISRGLPNKLIAVELNISEFTVKVHIQNILRKLGVYNRTAAAAIFHAGAKL